MSHIRVYKSDSVYSLKTHQYTNWSVHVEVFGWRFSVRTNVSKLPSDDGSRLQGKTWTRAKEPTHD